MVSLWKASKAFQFSFFGALMELTSLGDHESVTSLVSLKFVHGIIHVGCYTQENNPVLFEFHTAYGGVDCTAVMLTNL